MQKPEAWVVRIDEERCLGANQRPEIVSETLGLQLRSIGKTAKQVVDAIRRVLRSVGLKNARLTPRPP